MMSFLKYAIATGAIGAVFWTLSFIIGIIIFCIFLVWAGSHFLQNKEIENDSDS